MSKIDYNSSMVGEFFPLIANANKLGHLGFLHHLRPSPLPGSDYYGYMVWTTDKLNLQKFNWYITPLLYNKVLISCIHPISEVNYLLGVTKSGDDNFVVLEEKQRPLEWDEVSPINMFELIFAEGSPLFFHIRGCNQKYLSSQGIEMSLLEDTGYYWVGCALDERVKDDPLNINLITWYLAIDQVATSTPVLESLQHAIPFAALSKKLGLKINTDFLGKLTGNYSNQIRANSSK